MNTITEAAWGHSLLSLVLECGKEIKSAHNALFEGKKNQTTYKADRTPVTELDTLINQKFADWAKGVGISFFGEEGNLETASDYHLLVDPLDGTTAFMRGMNTATIIVSLLRVEYGVGRPVFSIIHAPVAGRTWFTQDGKTLLLSSSLHGKDIYTINNAKRPWLSNIVVFPGAGFQMSLVKQLAEEGQTFDNQEMGAFGISAGLIASGILSVAAIGPTSAVESVAMQLIVDNAGGYSCDLMGDPLGEYKIDMLRGKRDYVLPSGAIFAADKRMAEALVNIVHEANS